MWRAPVAAFVSLSLSACSVGYVSMPFTTAPAGPDQQLQIADPNIRTASRTEPKSGLGGPQPTPASLLPATSVSSTASTVRPASLLTTASTRAPAAALQLINDLRRTKGLPALKLSPELTQAAQIQAANLARSGTLGHIGPDGSTPLDRVRRAGYRPRMAAENVAGGQVDVAAAVASWRESESHLRNLLLPDATEMGIAVFDDGRSGVRAYWALVLGASL